jgi:hypothetical protein
MTRIKMIGLAIMAVFAVFAIAATSATAAKNPVLVNAKGEAGAFHVSGTSNGTSFLESSVEGTPRIECATEASTATLTTTLEGDGMTSGQSTVTFKTCKTSAGKCSNTATTGEITGTVSVLLVWVGKETNKTVGVLISILPYTGTPGSQNGLLSFVCSGTLSDVQGSFIALTNKKVLGAAFTVATLEAREKGKGKQEDKTYTENGVEGTNSLYSKTGLAGAPAEASETVENEETYTTSVKVIES